MDGGHAVQTPAAAPAPATSPKAVIHLFNGKDLTGWTPDVPARDADPNGRPASSSATGCWSASASRRAPAHRRPLSRLPARGRVPFPGKAGNCGVLVHASTPRALYKMFPQSIEVQMMSGNAGDFWCIQEDIKVPDMESGVRARRARSGARRRRCPPHPEPHRQLGEAARPMEPPGHRSARPHHHGLGERRPGEQGLRRHRRIRARLPCRPRAPRSSSARWTSVRSRP